MSDEVIAYAWRKEGMNGWALGHNPPTPNMKDFDKYEVRELVFRTPDFVTLTQAEFDALNRDSDVLAALEAGGVDNWEGYDEAMRILEEDDESK